MREKPSSLPILTSPAHRIVGARGRRGGEDEAQQRDGKRARPRKRAPRAVSHLRKDRRQSRHKADPAGETAGWQSLEAGV